MKLLTFLILLVGVKSQFDVVARYQIVDGFDQVKCLKSFTPRDLKEGITKITEFLLYIEEGAKTKVATAENYLLNNEINDRLAYEWTSDKQPYVLTSKLSEFPTLCKSYGGSLPSPTTEPGVSKLKKWLTAIGVAANLVLPVVRGKLMFEEYFN